jgi:lysozyme family protein
MTTLSAEGYIGRILGHEGGYSNDPKDPGGETNWGISKRSYPNVDIKNLTRDGAIAIYKRDFWAQCGQGLALGVMFQVLDASVNHGIGNAIRMLQRAVGVADDGHWGSVSITAYMAMSVSDVLMLFLAERGEFMAKLKTFDTFGRGWTRRICLNLRYAAQDN